jgi:hypothetical protein
MNLPLPAANFGTAFAAFVHRPFVPAQAWPPSEADWPDQAVDACAPEGAYPADLERPVPADTRVWS